MPVYTEQELIVGCRQKDRQYQEQLYKQYYSMFLLVCARYAKDMQDAEQLLNDGFLKVFTHIGSFKDKGSFEGWMRRIFVNTAINHYHKNRKLQDQLDYSAVEEITPSGDDIISQISGQELLELVNQLPDGYKVVFNLYVVEGFNHREIGEMLNIAEGTSKSQLAKAKIHLKKLLQKYSISENAD